MSSYLALTVIADDRPGIIDLLSNTITNHQGNWMESSMARLVGKFAGILLVEVADNNRQALSAALQALNSDSITLTIEQSGEDKASHSDVLCVEIVASDRPGIVSEISQLLAGNGINIESLETFCESAPMSAELMFHAHAYLAPPAQMDASEVANLLETLSDDLMVEILD